MNLQHFERGDRGVFLFRDENRKRIAEMTYVNVGENTLKIDHTEVQEDHRGKGFGKRLVAAAVEFARDRGLKISASCPFAKKILEKEASYSDVFVS